MLDSSYITCIKGGDIDFLFNIVLYSAAGLTPISKESFPYNINHPQTEEALKSLQYSRSILAGIHLHLFSVKHTAGGPLPSVGLYRLRTLYICNSPRVLAS